MKNLISPIERKSVRQLQRAKFLFQTLGAKTAAGYMRNRGWSLESALWNLLRKERRDHSVAA